MGLKIERPDVVAALVGLIKLETLLAEVSTRLVASSWRVLGQVLFNSELYDSSD